MWPHILCSVLADCYGCCGVLWCIAVHNDLSTLYMLQWASMHSAEQPCNSKVALLKAVESEITLYSIQNMRPLRIPFNLFGCTYLHTNNKKQRAHLHEVSHSPAFSVVGTKQVLRAPPGVWSTHFQAPCS